MTGRKPQFHRMPGGLARMKDAIRNAKPIDQTAPEAAIETPGFTDHSEGDAWHQTALRYADRIAEGRGTMVTAFKTGNTPTSDGTFPATAFCRSGGRFYFSGSYVQGRGWIITPRKGPNPEFDVEKGRPAPVGGQA